MVDIHTHIIYGVDDGASDIETSVAILKDEAAQGVTHIIATPHYRRGMFGYKRDVIEAHFAKLKEIAADSGIKLYLGCEYHTDHDILYNIRSGRIHTLGDSRYVLMEFKHASPREYIAGEAEKLIFSGFSPVIAHAERYECIRSSPEILKDLRAMGCMIQINAGSILGAEGLRQRSLCKKILSNMLCDIIASDVHDIGERRSLMKKGFEHVEKKYGAETAHRYFVKGPMKIIEETGRKQA